MSMTSDPTNKTQTHASFIEAHKGKSFTALGTAYNEARSKRHEFLGCPEGHEITTDTTKGTGAPSSAYIKIADWGHRDHPLTCLGPMISTKGTMFAWYCQTDDVVCYDTKS